MVIPPFHTPTWSFLVGPPPPYKYIHGLFSSIPWYLRMRCGWRIESQWLVALTSMVLRKFTKTRPWWWSSHLAVIFQISWNHFLTLEVQYFLFSVDAVEFLPQNKQFPHNKIKSIIPSQWILRILENYLSLKHQARQCNRWVLSKIPKHPTLQLTVRP